MADPWQNYLTAMQVLTSLEERLLAKRSDSDRTFADQDARARRLEQRATAELTQTRSAIVSAEANLERFRAALGVPIPVNDPDHSCTSAAQAKAAADAASAWVTEADAVLTSLRRTEERIARTPATPPPAPKPVPAPAQSRTPIWLATAAMLAFIVIIAVALAVT